MQSKGAKYASVLVSYPVACFVMVKIVEYFGGFSTPSWIYLAAILIGHIFSLIYIARGLIKS
jgi:hypothetical protein